MCFCQSPYLIWLKIPQRKRRWFCVFFFSCCRGPGCGEGHRCEEEASRKVIYSSILDCQTLGCAKKCWWFGLLFDTERMPQQQNQSQRSPGDWGRWRIQTCPRGLPQLSFSSCEPLFLWCWWSLCWLTWFTLYWFIFYVSGMISERNIRNQIQTLRMFLWYESGPWHGS